MTMLGAEALLPPLLLLLAMQTVPARALGRTLGNGLVLGGLAVILGRYVHWRWTETLPWGAETSIQTTFVWALFVIEMLTWADAAIFLAQLSRQTDRRAEADAHEARLRARDPDRLPSVDVLIPTYDEPLDVLEKAIVSALDLDWPAHRIRVCVLDDRRRGWLRAFCREVGAVYMTRAENVDAKAGNINAALRRLEGEFFLVLDADFAPTRPMLMRMMGFFDDPSVGIVQAPHVFFNHDPFQSSLHLGRAVPDDQRLFFEVILPGRDGWNAAFCCGSNGIVRRASLRSVGDRLPAGSITEDMLLTLALKRRGYVTRYLCEPLARGLAPESLDAFFVQRARWARGAIQILFLREGPFGPGLRPVDRIFFLPTNWLIQPVAQVAAVLIPALYLLTGLAPLHDAQLSGVLLYQVPALLGTLFVIRLFAGRFYVPLAATALAVLQAIRVLPVALATLFRPFGHGFKVTPKGRAANGVSVDWSLAAFCATMVAATGIGLALDSQPEWRITHERGLVPVIVFWSLLNMVVLSLVATTAVSCPPARMEERFLLETGIRLRTESGRFVRARTENASLSGLAIRVDDPSGRFILEELDIGGWAVVDMPSIGRSPVRLVGIRGATYALAFAGTGRDFRHGLIRALFGGGIAQPGQRVQRRAPLERAARLVVAGGRELAARICDASPSGASLVAETPDGRRAAESIAAGAEASVWIEDVGTTRAQIVRVTDGVVALAFLDAPARFRAAMERTLGAGEGPRAAEPGQWRLVLRIVARILAPDRSAACTGPLAAPATPPDWAVTYAAAPAEPRSRTASRTG